MTREVMKNTKGAITPVVATQIRKLAESGTATIAGIARATGLSRKSVSEHLRKFPPRVRVASAEPNSSVEIPKAENLPSPPITEDADGRSIVGQRLAEVRAIIASLKPLERPLEAAGAYDRYARLESVLAEVHESMRPPREADPESDVAHRGMADALVKKLERSVRAAEDRFKCHACGQSPYAPNERISR